MDDVPFDNPELEVPGGLVTDELVLRPIVEADAEADHAAVVESRDFLRVWEQTGWPEDGFTVAANREDLAKLERRHASREAFTYTVVDPAGTECLGCVYLLPPDARSLGAARITPVGDDRWDDHGAAVYFWVRRSRLDSGLDRRLLDALRGWLAQDWRGLGRWLFVTNEELAQQVATIERTDLQLRFHIDEPGKPGRYLAYGEPRG